MKPARSSHCPHQHVYRVGPVALHRASGSKQSMTVEPHGAPIRGLAGQATSLGRHSHVPPSSARHPHDASGKSQRLPHSLQDASTASWGAAGHVDAAGQLPSWLPRVQAPFTHTAERVAPPSASYSHARGPVHAPPSAGMVMGHDGMHPPSQVRTHGASGASPSPKEGSAGESVVASSAPASGAESGVPPQPRPSASKRATALRFTHERYVRPRTIAT